MRVNQCFVGTLFCLVLGFWILRFFSDVSGDELDDWDKVDLGSRVGVGSIQGKRGHMEDQWDVHEEEGEVSGAEWYSIYDGHAGSKCSKFLHANLRSSFFALATWRADPVNALQEAFRTTSDKWLVRANRWFESDGSTAVVALRVGDELYVAHVGDSPAVLWSGGKTTPLINPHKPNRADERERIEQIGGKVSRQRGDVWRVQGTLAVSRAFGDRDLRRYGVIAVPEVNKYTLSAKSGDFLLLASDGLFEEITFKDAISFVNTALEQGDPINEIALALANLAEQKGSYDNISVIIVLLESEISVDTRQRAEE